MSLHASLLRIYTMHLAAVGAWVYYIPEVNYLMMVLTVIVVAVFKTTVQLGNAYGKSPPCLVDPGCQDLRCCQDVRSCVMNIMTGALDCNATFRALSA